MEAMLICVASACGVRPLACGGRSTVRYVCDRGGAASRARGARCEQEEGRVVSEGGGDAVLRLVSERGARGVSRERGGDATLC